MRCGRVRVNTFLLPGCGRAPFRFLDQCLPPLECFRYSKSVGWRLLASWAASWPLYLRQSFVIVHVRGFDVTRFFSGARCLTEVGNSWILDIRGNFRVFLLTIWPSFCLRLDLLFSSRGSILCPWILDSGLILCPIEYVKFIFGKGWECLDRIPRLDPLKMEELRERER